ncbi:MAG: DUF4252 domain-containing protein [Acidobacteriota bacterium]
MFERRIRRRGWMPWGLFGVLCCLPVVPSTPAGAADGGTPKPVEEHPGFFDFGSLDLFDREDLDVHISVKGPLLRLVAEASGDTEPELSDMLSRLRGVEVRVYDIPQGQRDGARRTLDTTAEALERRGWDVAITVRVDRDHGYAFLRMDGGQPVGLVAMYVTEGDQAVFVNIVGTIDTAAIGRLARRFDIDLSPVPPPADPGNP